MLTWLGYKCNAVLKSLLLTHLFLCTGVGSMVEARCPVCGGVVELPSDVVAGEIVEHECGVTLEVILDETNKQPKLKPFEGIGEDWGE